jgi:hypothetical protein
MLLAKPLGEGVKRGGIKCSIRVWINPRVKVGGRFRLKVGGDACLLRR